MNRWAVILAVILLTTAVAFGCSSGGGNPMAPAANPDLTGSVGHVGQAQTHLWGYYDVYIDIENQSVEAVLNRMCMFTANVTTFVNNPASNLSFKIYGTPATAEYVDVDINVTIKHPFPGMTEYNGYDVKGVFMGSGSSTMKYSSKLKYAKYGTDQAMYDFNDKATLPYLDPYGDSLVGMPDGYTRWFNAKEFTFPGIMGYTQGKLATPGYQSMLTATLNGYKYFADGLGADEDLWTWLNANADTNGVFSAGTSNTRNYYLRFPTSKGVKYGYAVVASWKGSKPADHPANAPEAAACKADITPNVYYVDATHKGGDLILDVNLWGWDYQPTLIKIESTVLSAVHAFTPAEMTPVGGGDHYAIYHCGIPADAVTGTEGNEFWVVAEYGDFDYTCSFTPPGGAPVATLAAFFRYDLMVLDACLQVLSPNGAEEWAVDSNHEITWDSYNVSGTVFIEYSKDNFVADLHSIATGEANDGSFMWDPIPNDLSNTVRVRVSSTNNPSVNDMSDDDFSIVPTPTGNLVWAKRAGGASYYEWGYGITTLSDNSTVVTGVFNGSATFGPGEPNQTVLNTAGGNDFFIARYNPDGTLAWAKRAGGASDNDYSNGITTLSDNSTVVTGHFGGSATFGPGEPNETVLNSAGGYDIFIARFAP